MIDETLLLQKRLQELAHKAEILHEACFSSFLTLAEQDIAAKMQLSQIYRAYGGYPEAERKILCFGPEAPPPICFLHIFPRQAKFSQALTHRDFLGAVLSLGIKRQVLGDILLNGNQAFCICLHSIAGYIIEQLQQVKRTPVCVEQKTSLPAYILPQPRALYVSVASLRLDALIAAVYRLSREDSRRLCLQEKVFINGSMCTAPEYILKPRQIVSVRGLGRFRYQGEQGTTKKGRTKTMIDIYE